VRAGFGVAETGSVFLTEDHFKVNALGFLSQHLVVLLDPRDLVPNLHHAYQHRGFFEARYAVLMTGPSATADIEGVLIRGAQGIRSLTVIPRTGRGPARLIRQERPARCLRVTACSDPHTRARRPGVVTAAEMLSVAAFRRRYAGVGPFGTDGRAGGRVLPPHDRNPPARADHTARR
jgi:hypothetical protein